MPKSHDKDKIEIVALFGSKLCQEEGCGLSRAGLAMYLGLFRAAKTAQPDKWEILGLLDYKLCYVSGPFSGPPKPHNQMKWKMVFLTANYAKTA